jgi:hypothetical protein
MEVDGRFEVQTTCTEQGLGTRDWGLGGCWEPGTVASMRRLGSRFPVPGSRPSPVPMSQPVWNKSCPDRTHGDAPGVAGTTNPPDHDTPRA